MATEIRTREIAMAERSRAVGKLCDALEATDRVGEDLTEVIKLVRTFKGEAHPIDLGPLDELAGQTARLERALQQEIRRVAESIPGEKAGAA